jgi:hypothetical protein
VRTRILKTGGKEEEDEGKTEEELKEKKMM